MNVLKNVIRYEIVFMGNIFGLVVSCENKFLTIDNSFKYLKKKKKKKKGTMVVL